jgi:cytochrome c oxidase subunit III
MEIPYAVKPRPDTGLYNAKVGIWLFLASEVMLFGALFSSYILLRIGAPEGTWPHHWLNVWLGMTNTIVLIASSVTVVLAWASLKMNQFSRYRMYQGFTILCAFIFMGIKSVEYADKFNHYEVTLANGKVVDGHINREKSTVQVPSFPPFKITENKSAKAQVVVIDGQTVDSHADLMDGSKHGEHKEVVIPIADIKKIGNYGPWHNTYTAIYFTLTGLHAIHVIGGAIVIFAIWGPLAGGWRKDPEHYTNRVEVSGLFWHLVDLVWIFLFPVLYLL